MTAHSSRFAFFVMSMGVVLSGCSKPPVTPLPPPPAETVVAKVAVPVSCEIAQVPVPDYPARLARPGDDIFTLSKIAAADRRVRMAETEKLRASSNNPCPAKEPK